MVQLQYFDARTAQLSSVLQAVRDDGAVVVVNAISAADCDAILSELDPFLKLAARGTEGFGGLNTRRTTGLIGRSRTFGEKCVLNKWLVSVAEDQLLPFCDRIRVMATQSINIGPGSPAQPWHRDRNAWGPLYLQEQVEPEVGSMWALQDFTKQNGCTRVAPRTHARPLSEGVVPTEEETCYAEMPKGSVLIYTGSVLHSGGANMSDEWRMGVHLSFALGWLRQQENQYLSVPPHIARTLNPAVQELIGYAMPRYGFGYYGAPTMDDVKNAAGLFGNKGELEAEAFRDVLSPEMALQRKPRKWEASAGVHKTTDKFHRKEDNKEVVEVSKM